MGGKEPRTRSDQRKETGPSSSHARLLFFTSVPIHQLGFLLWHSAQRHLREWEQSPITTLSINLLPPSPPSLQLSRPLSPCSPLLPTTIPLKSTEIETRLTETSCL